jgi:hypothetical protein
LPIIRARTISMRLRKRLKVNMIKFNLIRNNSSNFMPFDGIVKGKMDFDSEYFDLDDCPRIR